MEIRGAVCNLPVVKVRPIPQYSWLCMGTSMGHMILATVHMEIEPHADSAQMCSPIMKCARPAGLSFRRYSARPFWQESTAYTPSTPPSSPLASLSAPSTLTSQGLMPAQAQSLSSDKQLYLRAATHVFPAGLPDVPGWPPGQCHSRTIEGKAAIAGSYAVVVEAKPRCLTLLIVVVGVDLVIISSRPFQLQVSSCHMLKRLNQGPSPQEPCNCSHCGKVHCASVGGGHGQPTLPSTSRRPRRLGGTKQPGRAEVKLGPGPVSSVATLPALARHCKTSRPSARCSRSPRSAQDHGVGLPPATAGVASPSHSSYLGR